MYDLWKKIQAGNFERRECVIFFNPQKLAPTKIKPSTVFEDIFEGFEDILKGFEDIFQGFNDIFKGIEDIFKWFKDIFKWIKDILNLFEDEYI